MSRSDAGKGDDPRPNPQFSTNFKKVKKVIDWDYRNHVKELGCLVCGKYADPHHVRSRGAGHGDKSNLVPLCRIHHTECHTIGRVTCEDKYKLGSLRTRAENIQGSYDETK